MGNAIAPQGQAQSTEGPRRLSDLSQSSQLLVSIMHDVQFGRFENLTLARGEPVLDPAPDLIRVTKIGSDTVDHDPNLTDWTLPSSVVELLNEFAHIRDGIVRRVEFRHGLPVLIEARIAVKPASPFARRECT
jgi:hypothetical protein